MSFLTKLFGRRSDDVEVHIVRSGQLIQIPLNSIKIAFVALLYEDRNHVSAIKESVIDLNRQLQPRVWGQSSAIQTVVITTDAGGKKWAGVPDPVRVFSSLEKAGMENDCSVVINFSEMSIGGGRGSKVVAGFAFRDGNSRLVLPYGNDMCVVAN